MKLYRPSQMLLDEISDLPPATRMRILNLAELAFLRRQAIEAGQRTADEISAIADEYARRTRGDGIAKVCDLNSR